MLSENVWFFAFGSVFSVMPNPRRTTNRRPDLSIIAPGRCAARMPGTGPLRRSSVPARKKAIVGKSRVEPDRLQRPAFVFLALAMIGITFFRSPRQRIFDQIELQIELQPVSKAY